MFLLKIIKSAHRKVTNLHVLSLCAITFFSTVLLGFLAPFAPMMARESLAYATGWMVELTFLYSVYLVVKNWSIINQKFKYFVLSGTTLLSLMYGLWLFINYGDLYPYISAIGFNIATSFRSVAICILLAIVFSQYKLITKLKHELEKLKNKKEA